MINQERITIQPNKLLKFIGVGVFMFWFLMKLESSISIFLRNIATYPPIKINFSLAYVAIEFFTLGVILFLFFKFINRIKQNYNDEVYLKRAIVLFVIGIVFLNLFLFIMPFQLTKFLMENFEFNESYEKSSVTYVTMITLIVTFIIKLIVLAYTFLKNTNFQNSSASS